MKPKEKKPEDVYRVINRDTGKLEGAYSRAYCTEYDFNSVSQARGSMCSGTYENKCEYKIAKYRVTYELIDDDCDPATQDELDAHKKEKEEAARKDEELRLECKELGLTSFEDMLNYSVQKSMKEYIDSIDLKLNP